MTEQEAIKILDPDAKEVWKAYDGKDLERCNEACRLAVKALKLTEQIGGVEDKR